MIASRAHRQHRRPLIARERFQAHHLRAEIAERQERQTAGDRDRAVERARFEIRDPPHMQGGAGGRVQVRLGGGELQRLRDRQVFGRPIARQRLHERGETGHRQGQRQRLPVQRPRRVTQQDETGDGDHRPRGRLVTGDEDVDDLVRPGRAPHRVQRIDAPGPVHERVHQRDEGRRRGPADRNRDAGREVHAGRDLAAPIEVDAEEDRLREERITLEREGDPDRFAERAHEARPQQAELERQHGPRDGADGEQDARPLRELLGQQQVFGIARAPVIEVGQHHESRQRDAGRREHDVKRQRDPHLGARVREAVPPDRHDDRIVRRTPPRC
jgi:hypothetical protein